MYLNICEILTGKNKCRRVWGRWTAAACHDVIYSMPTLWALKEDYRKCHVCWKCVEFGKILPHSPQKATRLISTVIIRASSSTLDQKGSTPESTPRPRSGVFQPVTRCILRQPCAPANGTKTKHFIRLIASVCTSWILMGIERPEENRTRLRQSVNGTEVLVSEGESGLWKHLMQTIWRGW